MKILHNFFRRKKKKENLKQKIYKLENLLIEILSSNKNILYLDDYFRILIKSMEKNNKTFSGRIIEEYMPYSYFFVKEELYYSYYIFIFPFSFKLINFIKFMESKNKTGKWKNINKIKFKDLIYLLIYSLFLIFILLKIILFFPLYLIIFSSADIYTKNYYNYLKFNIESAISCILKNNLIVDKKIIKKIIDTKEIDIDKKKILNIIEKKKKILNI